jgi:hypothetical protein
MSEEDLELLTTLDDPGGEDDLGEDTFHNLLAEIPVSRFPKRRDTTSKQMILCEAKAPRGEEL